MKPLTDNQHFTPADVDSFEYQVTQSSIESIKDLLYDTEALASEGDEWAKATVPFLKAELKSRGVKV